MIRWCKDYKAYWMWESGMPYFFTVFVAGWIIMQYNNLVTVVVNGKILECFVWIYRNRRDSYLSIHEGFQLVIMYMGVVNK